MATSLECNPPSYCIASALNDDIEAQEEMAQQEVPIQDSEDEDEPAASEMEHHMNIKLKSILTDCSRQRLRVIHWNLKNLSTPDARVLAEQVEQVLKV